MCLCLLLTRLPIFRSMATLTSRLRLTRVLRVCHQSCRPVPCSQTLPVNTVLAKNSSLPHPLVGALSRFCHNLSGQEEQEIYSGILSTQIKLVKSFSLGTSMIGKCYFSFSPPPFYSFWLVRNGAHFNSQSAVFIRLLKVCNKSKFVFMQKDRNDGIKFNLK